MIRWIIEYSIRNRFLVLLLTAGLIAESVRGVYHLKLDAPDNGGAGDFDVRGVVCVRGV